MSPPLFNPSHASYIIWQGGRPNVAGALVDSPLEMYATGVNNYISTPCEDCSLRAITLAITADALGNLASTWTIDARINGVKVAQLLAVFPDTLVARTAAIKFGRGEHPIAVGDRVDVVISTAGDVNGNSEMNVQVLAHG